MKIKKTLGSVVSVLAESLVGTLPEVYKRSLLGEKIDPYTPREEIPQQVIYGRRTQRATMLSAGVHVTAAAVNMWYTHQTGKSILDEHLGLGISDLGVLLYTIAESGVRVAASTKRNMHLGSLLGYTLISPHMLHRRNVNSALKWSQERVKEREARRRSKAKV